MLAILRKSTALSQTLRHQPLQHRCQALSVVQSRWAHKIVKVPTMAESISEGELARWEKKVGQFVKQDELVATIETDKIDVPVNSPESGVIVEVFAQEGDSVQVGQDFYKLDLDGKAGAAPSAASSASTPAPAKKEQQTSQSAKPANVPPPKMPPPPKVAAQTPIAAAAPKKESAPAPSAPVAPVNFGGEVAGLAPLPGAFRLERRVKMNRMRQRIAERLKESQNTAASLTTFNEIDMSSIMEFRNRYKDEILKEHGVKLGFMSAFVKASVAALQAVPSVNARIDGYESEEPTLVYNDFCDVSIAVATPKGLVTPVLRNVEKLNFLEIERAIAAYGAKARDNKISIEDMAGGTFTISNGGVFGSLYGTPILNTPQSGILGMHAVKDRAVAVNGKVEVRPMMYIALTYDHRVIDGREAVTFLKTIKECVEDPRKLLLF